MSVHSFFWTDAHNANLYKCMIFKQNIDSKNIQVKNKTQACHQVGVCSLQKSFAPSA